MHACNVINNHSLVYCDNVPSQTSTTNCSNNYFDVITDDSTLLSSGNISDITLSESRFKKKKFASIWHRLIPDVDKYDLLVVLQLQYKVIQKIWIKKMKSKSFHYH